MKRLLAIVFTIYSFCSYGQSDTRWKDYFSYQNTKKIINYKEKVLAVSTYGFFTYNPSDNSVEKFSKINGLSGNELSSAYYNEDYDLLIITYENGEFSIVDSNNQVVKISEISNSSISGSKKINDISYYDDILYLACDFGIVQYNLNRMEFGDTFYFGQNGSYIKVNSISIDDNLIYAATEYSIYKADLNNKTLVDYRQWDKINEIASGEYNSVVALSGKVYANMLLPTVEQFYFDGNNWQNISNSTDIKGFSKSDDYFLIVKSNNVEQRDSNNQLLNNFTAPSGVYWGANDAVLINGALYVSTDTKGVSGSDLGSEFIYPNGPQRNDGFRINAYPRRLYISYGQYDFRYAPKPRLVSPEYKLNGEWKSIPLSEINNLKGIIDIIENPFEESDLFLIGFGTGVVHKKEEGSVFYNHQNSTLQKLIYPEDPNYVSIRMGGAKYDDDGNLWIMNGWNVLNPFVMYSKENKWYSFNTSDVGMVIDYGMSRPVIDEFGNKWVGTRNLGLWVFNENKTFGDSSDDLKKIFTQTEGKGSLPSIDVRSIAVDKDQNMWIGTTKGLVVFNDVENLPNLSTYDAIPVIIEENGVGQKLLGELYINKIVVDGGNNKWFATSTGGVYYTSYNGQKTIYHFTEANSPLPSDNVMDLDIDPETGEVYFLTTKGLVSFQGQSTEANSNFDNLIVYPNPVKPGYDGEIFIRGLGEKSNIKITDVNGNLIYETTSNGGMATWNGNSLDGTKVASGVYFIFALSSDGQDSKITKLLIVR